MRAKSGIPLRLRGVHVPKQVRRRGAHKIKMRLLEKLPSSMANGKAWKEIKGRKVVGDTESRNASFNVGPVRRTRKSAASSGSPKAAGVCVATPSEIRSPRTVTKASIDRSSGSPA